MTHTHTTMNNRYVKISQVAYVLNSPMTSQVHCIASLRKSTNVQFQQHQQLLHNPAIHLFAQVLHNKLQNAYVCFVISVSHLLHFNASL